jgi:predicted nucleic acid-binding protein
MIVISDTTPLRYLIEIEEIHILEKLFGRIIIPEKVFEELQGKKTPEKVKAWIQSRPAWLEVRKADTSLYTPKTSFHMPPAKLLNEMLERGRKRKKTEK